MKSFIKHITGSDERLILRARLHWIYIISGFSWIVVLAALGTVFDRLLWEFFGPFVPNDLPGIFGHLLGAPVMTMLFGACGVVIFILKVIKVFATEIALTNQRLIYKTGLIFVDVNEIDLIEIRAEHVHHGMLGRFLNYGQLHMDSRFVGDIALPAVKDPYRLLKAMHSARKENYDFLNEKEGKRVSSSTELTKQHDDG